MCLSGEPYAQCCGRFHSGRVLPATAEQLMRSRYSAFVLLDEDYLLRTHHPSTAPAGLDLDPAMEWRRLDIVATGSGGPFDTAGTVEFRAYYRHGKERGVLHEDSRFVREDGRWLYVDGDILA
ncbi:YchJ family protein [Pseudarthrobacter sp. BRE9]|jgi:SEC-C motif domain protein|uniref:YchJ family protein n=1 Tax=Pseudarthrobacter sp. BRE9 TaxID=2962582 RepID=UPI00288119FE|nr:YchJ family protein [Pseudarthrobacter sp. BRE9]MDT0171295.1 YchJ family protein [Pseudarthrobacter sp. BRE9]